MTRTRTQSSGWEGILEPGERVLWQGQPVPDLDWSEVDRRDIIFGLVFAGFAVFWMVVAAASTWGEGAAMVLPLFGLFFLAIGLKRAGGSVLLDARRRRGTWYTLTDRRAFVASDLGGRRTLEAYPIDATTRIDHDPTRGHIWFATDFVKKGRKSRKRRIGFTHLSETRTVHDLMQQVREGRT